MECCWAFVAVSNLNIFSIGFGCPTKGRLCWRKQRQEMMALLVSSVKDEHKTPWKVNDQNEAR